MVKVIEDENKIFEQMLKILYKNCPIVEDRSCLNVECEKNPIFEINIGISNKSTQILFASGTKSCSCATQDSIEVPRVMKLNEIERIIKFICMDYNLIDFAKDDGEFGREVEFKFDIKPDRNKLKGIYCGTISLGLDFRGNLELGKEYIKSFSKKYGLSSEAVDGSVEGVACISEDESEDLQETKECEYKLTASKVSKMIKNNFSKQGIKARVRVNFEHYEKATTTIEIINRAYLRGGFHTYKSSVLSEEKFKNIMKEEVEKNGAVFVDVYSNLKLVSNSFSKRFMEDGKMLADRSFTLKTQEPAKVLQKNKNN